jgi:hypothetical protein
MRKKCDGTMYGDETRVHGRRGGYSALFLNCMRPDIDFLQRNEAIDAPSCQCDYLSRVPVRKNLRPASIAKQH